MVHSVVPVLAFGRSITALGVVRIFGRRGAICYLAGSEGDPVVHSRWYRPAPPIVETADPVVLESYLAESGLDRAVLVPCSDRWAMCMARLPPTVKDSFPVSISPPEVLSLFVDKGKFAQLLESNHVPHPRTIVASLGEQIDSSSDQELKGYFLKPRHSQRCMKVFGKKAFFCSTAKEFRDHLRAMEQAGCGAVIQEYIPGPADAHYFIDGFIDRSGIVRAVFARRRLRIFPPDFGNSTAMVSVDVEEASPGIADLLRLLAAVGHRGIFSGEFKRDQRDGTFKLLEVNARAWWYVEFAALCGVDVCDLAYRDALEQEVPTVVGYEVGRWYAIPSLEFRALSTQLRRGDIGPLEWCLEAIRAIRGGRPADDPMPAVFSAANLVGKAWRQWTTRTGPVRHRR